MVAAGVALAITATGLAACGAGHEAHQEAISGRVLFARSCSACHSLSGVDDPRRQGGDLLSFSATRAQMTQLAAEMPVRPPLNPPELRAVVSFVLDTERQR